MLDIKLLMLLSIFSRYVMSINKNLMLRIDINKVCAANQNTPNIYTYSPLNAEIVHILYMVFS